MMRAYLSLGSNLGDSASLLRKALKMLPDSGVRVCRVSSFYKTEPVEFLAQPWFVNCAAEVETSLSPRALMRTLKALERAMGRRGGIPKGPRLIDIDLLLYENVVAGFPGLVVPHPRLTERRFVLIPLREIAPKVTHPVSGKTMTQMLRETGDKSKVVKMGKKMRSRG
jgi:2-amino-4-hydroxy-6-hydroxymethyldihydropteridine diphosphokinase